MFELWDTRNARLVGTFASESAALDAAYRELRAQAGSAAPEPVQRPHLAVAPARDGATPASSPRRNWVSSALRGVTLWFV